MCAPLVRVDGLPNETVGAQRLVRLDKLMPRRYDSLTGRAARHSE